MKKIQSLILEIRLVFNPAYGVNEIYNTILSIPGLTGEIKKHDSDSGAWATGLICIKELSCNCFISRLDIDQAHTEAEINSVRNEEGRTNTFQIRLSNFEDKSSEKNSDPTSSRVIFEYVQKRMKAKVFDETHYMWADY